MGSLPGCQHAAAAAFLAAEADYEAAYLLTLQAAWMADNSKPNSLQASMSKAKAGRTATEVTLKCVELCGALGYTEHELLEKWSRDAKILDKHAPVSCASSTSALGRTGVDRSLDPPFMRIFSPLMSASSRVANLPIRTPSSPTNQAPNSGPVSFWVSAPTSSYLLGHVGHTRQLARLTPSAVR
ncbi:hypothetical protein GCM10012275_48120 [Longimycelium tulufanense]|uniref:Acyl-CoA dehydrogenase/oxidase C-terminal domain-containing protein n=1 Tax=Longimycelium tulufanense TaxID=907463 RepID=A0A8J3FWH2_9PSEU|nr:hypothetical protein GCM10012275_48120 [Longimycelium tulufanense]